MAPTFASACAISCPVDECEMNGIVSIAVGWPKIPQKLFDHNWIAGKKYGAAALEACSTIIETGLVLAETASDQGL